MIHSIKYFMTDMILVPVIKFDVNLFFRYALFEAGALNFVEHSESALRLEDRKVALIS